MTRVGAKKSTGNKRRIITVSERPLMIVGAAALCGSILAVVAVACLGENFKPGAIGHLDQVGRIEVIRLPATARDLDGIRTFSVKMGGADDYGRVFVNNYLVLNTENPDKLFYTDNDPKEKKEAASKLALRRNQFMVGEAGVVHLLHRGKNYIVAEVENSLWGACSGGIEVIVNGSLLENFPRGFPDRLSVEEDVMNTGLRKLYDQSHVPAVFDALCSRRIFEFQLQ